MCVEFLKAWVVLSFRTVMEPFIYSYTVIIHNYTNFFYDFLIFCGVYGGIICSEGVQLSLEFEMYTPGDRFRSARVTS